ncbi:MAG: SIMPL domain-containing protein [Ornithinimicrobium sp.]|uniref:SIMPL domain-containing protein n=1 Tax=Ornithinimicrobium sp. TaxID=1977084 RepID=UPI0026E09DCF|nr:SIMPL domain-containing protein [Ornithinimicrobium sp.]MDO5738948.1 SIMPL domain-containing protein [Ornithinimicrobium sp.]
MTSPDTVVVSGTGRASAAPDSLVLDLQLEGHGSTVSEALAALTMASRACVEALPGHAVRTHGLGVHPRHDHQGQQVGHTAYQQVQVRTADPAGAGDLIQRLSDAVGNGLGVNGLRPEVADTAELSRQARDRAFTDARGRAEQYAALAGRALGGVLQVREGGVDGAPRPYGREDARMAMASGPVVDAADHEVVATVEVTWSLA